MTTREQAVAALRGVSPEQSAELPSIESSLNAR